jgi:hypothetical protein
VRSDSFHRQNVQRLAGFSCNRELYASLSLALAEIRLNPLKMAGSKYCDDSDGVICMSRRIGVHAG